MRPPLTFTSSFCWSINLGGCSWINLCDFFLSARPLTSDSDFEFPEMDGSAVEETCRILPEPSPSPSPTQTTAKPPPVTKKVLLVSHTSASVISLKLFKIRLIVFLALLFYNSKQIVITTKKLEVRTPPKQPEAGAPVRPQPAPAGPAADQHPAVRLLQLLLARAAASQPGFVRPTSDSDESAATLPRRAVRNRWNTGFFSSSDSSDES